MLAALATRGASSVTTPAAGREARAALLLEETKRSLVMLDQFMSRSPHHCTDTAYTSSCDAMRLGTGQPERHAMQEMEVPKLVTQVPWKRASCSSMTVPKHITSAVN
jgi:hypothetical protein